MSFEPPAGILDIGNATLRVGKLEVAETTGLNQGLQNVIKNDLLVTENTTYTTNQKWGIKLPTTWVAEFEVKGHSGKYIDFNFYNENSVSNAQGYNLTFMDTTMTLKYDNGSALGGGAVTIPTIVGTYRKVHIFFERNVIAVSIDGTRYLYDKRPSVLSRVISATGSAFVNLFIEADGANSAFKNLRIVNGRFISDETSNIAFVGGNLGVGVHSPQEALDIRGNMHFNKVSNVSSVSVDSNVVTEYTGPHERPLRKYPEVALTADDNLSTSGYKASVSSFITGNNAFRAFDTRPATNSTYWHSQHPYYTHATGTYNPGQEADGAGTPATDTTLPTTELISGHQGEWIKLQMPTRIKLEEVRVFASHRCVPGVNVYQMPKDIAIAGSNDGTNWYLVDSGTLRTDIRELYGMASLFVTTSSYYSYLALIVKSIDNQGQNYSAVEIANIEYYGREEGSASLDTTLKSVYNVPATTGTQLEVYYDGQDYSDVPSSVTDKSGNENHASTVGTGVGFDSTYKAFTFNGTSTGKIVGTHDFSDASPVLTMSFWMKRTAVVGSYDYIATIGTAATGQMIGLTTNPSNQFNFGNEGDGVITDESILLNQWYHVTLVANGEAAFNSTNFKPYINGKEPKLSSYGGDSTTNLTGSQVTFGTNSNGGQPFKGSIANFRLYSKVLSADQIKELYDFQKDYFLGSKSQVTLYKGHLGVGVTEPSGQLELAGDERIQEYPPRAITVLNYNTHIEGHGDFEFSASPSNYVGNTDWDFTKAFENTGRNNVGWHGNSTNISAPGSYQAVLQYAPAVTSGNGLVESILKNGSVVLGEWIQMRSPYAINVTRLGTVPRQNYGNSRGIGKFAILGSNNGIDWEYAGEGAIAPWNTSSSTDAGGYGTRTSETIAHVSTNSNGRYYIYHRLVVTHIMGHRGASGHPQYSSGGSESVNQSYIRFYGTPSSTTLDKGSLSLTRSLDVPRVSRYDVDTETPRPERLILDYDTSVNPYPLDISGRGNHGTCYGNAYYSEADKAFKFDGTNDTVYVDHNGNTGSLNGFPTGDATYTMSCWMKPHVLGTSSAIFYFGSAWTTSQLAGIYFTSGNAINMDVGAYHLTTAGNILKVNEWAHVAIVKRGTGNVNNTHSWGSIYINGEEVPTTIGNGGGQQSLSIVDNLSIGSNFNGSPGGFGEDFDGCIAKPQVWSVPLENSEIRKIYNLGYTGRSMVISDTAVGIGRHPRSQLDVRGVVRATSFLSESQPAFIAEGGSSTVYTTATIISAWTTIVNRGGMFKSNGYVYAPSDGIYFFHTNLYNEGGHIIILDLYLNDKIKIRGELASGTGNNSICTLFATFYMNKGDYVYLKNGPGRSEIIKPVDSAECYNQFVGYKLS